MKTKHPLAAAAVALALLSTAATAAADPGRPADLKKARDTSAPYRHLDTAKVDGYGLLTDARGVACIDNPGVGGMGIHYVKNELVGDYVVAPRVRRRSSTSPGAAAGCASWRSSTWCFRKRGMRRTLRRLSFSDASSS